MTHRSRIAGLTSMKACVIPWTDRSAVRYAYLSSSADVDEGHDVHAMYEDRHPAWPAQPDARGCRPCWCGCGRRRAVAAERRHQAAKCSHVAERRDRLDQAGQTDDLDARVDRGEDLRPCLSAVDEHDVVPGAHGLVARDDGVLVRAAVYEARDDVSDP